MRSTLPHLTIQAWVLSHAHIHSRNPSDRLMVALACSLRQNAVDRTTISCTLPRLADAVKRNFRSCQEINLLTALAQDRNRFIGLALGADQYLIKPVTPQDLLLAVQRALQAKESARVAQLRALADGPVVP